MFEGRHKHASKKSTAPKKKATDEITYLRPVSNCSGCGDTKVSWSVHAGMRRFNRQLKLKGKDRYELIYAADRGCGNLQGYHAYGIVDAIFCMGTGAIVGDGIKDPKHVARMGNFHTLAATANESWVTVGETLPHDGWAGDTLLARVRWNRPNKFAPTG